jgi:hypothetical protein
MRRYSILAAADLATTAGPRTRCSGSPSHVWPGLNQRAQRHANLRQTIGWTAWCRCLASAARRDWEGRVRLRRVG